MSDSTNPNPADTGAAIAAVDDALARLFELRRGLVTLRLLDEAIARTAATPHYHGPWPDPYDDDDDRPTPEACYCANPPGAAHAAAMARWTPAVECNPTGNADENERVECHPDFTVAATAASDPGDFTRTAVATLYLDLRDADRVEYVKIEDRYYIPSEDLTADADRIHGIWPDDADAADPVHWCDSCGVGQNPGYLICPDCGNPTGSEGPSA